MNPRHINTAIKVFRSAPGNGHSLKSRIRARFSSLSSSEANELIKECREIMNEIERLAAKSFAGEDLSDEEEHYLESLPLTKVLFSDLWQTAMFAQFR